MTLRSINVKIVKKKKIKFDMKKLFIHRIINLLVQIRPSARHLLFIRGELHIVLSNDCLLCLSFSFGFYFERESYNTAEVITVICRMCKDADVLRMEPDECFHARHLEPL